METTTLSETAERENAAAGLAMLHASNQEQYPPDEHASPQGAEPAQSAPSTLGLWPPSRILTAHVKARYHQDSLAVTLLDCRGSDGLGWPVLPVGDCLEHRAPGKPPPFIVLCRKSELLPLALMRREELETCDDELYMTVNNLLEVLGRSRSTNWRQGVRHDESSGHKLNPCFWIEGGECVEAYMARSPPPQEPPPQLPMGPPRMRPTKGRVPLRGQQNEDGDSIDGVASSSRAPGDASVGAAGSPSAGGASEAAASLAAQHMQKQQHAGSGHSRPKRVAAGTKRYAAEMEIEQEEGKKQRKAHASKANAALSTSGSSTESQEAGLHGAPAPPGIPGGLGNDDMDASSLTDLKRAELVKRLEAQGVPAGQAAELLARCLRAITEPTSEGGHWHFHFNDGAPPAPSLNKAASRLVFLYQQQQQQQPRGTLGHEVEDVDVWMQQQQQQQQEQQQQQSFLDLPGPSGQQEVPKMESPQADGRQAAAANQAPRRTGRSGSRPAHQPRLSAQTSAAPASGRPSLSGAAAGPVVSAPPSRATTSVQQQLQQQQPQQQPAFESWSVDETAQWLLGQGCTAAAELFQRHNINARALAALARIGRSSDGLNRMIREEFPELAFADRWMLADAITRLMSS